MLKAKAESDCDSIAQKRQSKNRPDSLPHRGDRAHWKQNPFTVEDAGQHPPFNRRLYRPRPWHSLTAAISEIAKRNLGAGSLVASLPLISVLEMLWLWHDTADPERMGAHSSATFWYVLPSLPMYLLIPALLRRGLEFHAALAAGCALTIALYILLMTAAPRLGLKL